MSRTAAVVLVLILVGSLGAALSGGLVSATAAAGPAPTDRTSPPAAIEGDWVAAAQEFDRTEWEFTVHANGSATWIFRYKQTLSSDEVEDFEAFAEEFNNEETEMYRNFQTNVEDLTESGSEETGREMDATAFDRHAYVTEFENEGVVEMTFRWEGFADVEGDRVVVGDVFEGGLYIGPEQWLVVRPGAGLAFQAVQPPPDDTAGDSYASSDSITWIGERSFTDQRPLIVLAPADEIQTPSPTAAGTPGNATPGWMLPLGVLLLVAILGTGAAFAYRSGALDQFGQGPGGAGGAGAAAETDSDGGTSGATPISDEELLSDEDRVVDLLENNGGRMKQVDIVDQTGWSKSKVSMLLSDMEEEGTISKLRVGRENIISLAGHEPDAAGSPFDDE